MVNAQHIKIVLGWKTYVKDSEWIADLLQHGLLGGVSMLIAFNANCRIWQGFVLLSLQSNLERSTGSRKSSKMPASSLHRCRSVRRYECLGWRVTEKKASVSDFYGSIFIGDRGDRKVGMDARTKHNISF